MSKEQLLSEVLSLPAEDRRTFLHEIVESLSAGEEPGMAPELRAELDRRYKNMLEHPEDEVTWEQACAELDERKSRKQ